MEEFGLLSRLVVADDLVSYTLAGAWIFLSAIAVTAFAFTTARSALFGDGGDLASWGLRMLMVVGILSAYKPITHGVLGASEDLAGYMMDRAGWHEFSQHMADQFEPLFDDADVNAAAAAGDDERPPEPSMWDRLIGFMRGGMLTTVTFLTYYFVFIIYDSLRDLTAALAGLLLLIGPFLVAAGCLGEGRTLRQWFGSLIQVALWPVIPPFMMMIIVGTSGLAAQTGNTAFVIQQNIALAALTLLTPFLVAFIAGRGGVSALGTVLGTMKMAAFASIVRTVRNARGSSGVSAAANARADGSPPQDPPPSRAPGPRPGERYVWRAPGRSAPGGAPRSRSSSPRATPPPPPRVNRDGRARERPKSQPVVLTRKKVRS